MTPPPSPPVPSAMWPLEVLLACKTKRVHQAQKCTWLSQTSDQIISKG